MSAHQKARVETRLQGLRGFDQRDGARHLAERAGDARGAELRAVDVALHLAQGQRPLRQAAVGMEHGVRRTLPAVLRRPAAARPRLDEAVAVDVAVHVDPATAPARWPATTRAMKSRSAVRA